LAKRAALIDGLLESAVIRIVTESGSAGREARSRRGLGTV